MLVDTPTCMYISGDTLRLCANDGLYCTKHCTNPHSCNAYTRKRIGIRVDPPALVELLPLLLRYDNSCGNAPPPRPRR